METLDLIIRWYFLWKLSGVCSSRNSKATAKTWCVRPLNPVCINSFCWQRYEKLCLQTTAAPPLMLRPLRRCMWSDKSQAQNRQKMRMEVDEKIKAQSGRKHLKFRLCTRVRVCFFDMFPPESRVCSKPRWASDNRLTELTSEGKKQRGKRKREL